MDSENQLVIYYADDEYRVFCDVCDKLCIQRFHKNHLKSKTHKNKIRKIEQIEKSFQVNSLI